MVALAPRRGEAAALEIAGDVGGEPASHLESKGLLRVGEVEVHGFPRDLRQTRPGSGLATTPLIRHCPLSHTMS